jgi:hypothetical protein
MLTLLLASAPAAAADLEGNPTFGQFPGTAGLLTRPSRLGWEADPLVAVGASLDVGSPELDLSSRGDRWTHAWVLALPATVRGQTDTVGELDDTERGGTVRPYVGLGIARSSERTAFGASLVLDATFESTAAHLDQLSPLRSPGDPSSITWDGDVPSRGEGDAGRATGQDLDLALTTGFARIAGDNRPRIDVLARWIRAGERVRAAEGRPAGSVLTVPTSSVEVTAVDSVVGANPVSFWGLPNRSAAAFGAVGGLDSGGTVRDPRRRLEVGVEGGPTWPTYDQTRIVEGRYTLEPARSRITWAGKGARFGGALGATWGWVADADEAGEPPAVRVRAGWRLDGSLEQSELERCDGPTCQASRQQTGWGRLAVPTAVELRVSERVTVSAGLSPAVYAYHHGYRMDGQPGGGEALGVTDSEVVVGLGARGGVRYEHRGWLLGASFAGSSGGAVFSSGVAASTPFTPSPPPPPPLPEGLYSAGPAVSLSPLLWIGWRPPAAAPRS